MVVNKNMGRAPWSSHTCSAVCMRSGGMQPFRGLAASTSQNTLMFTAVPRCRQHAASPRYTQLLQYRRRAHTNLVPPQYRCNSPPLRTVVAAGSADGESRGSGGAKQRSKLPNEKATGSPNRGWSYSNDPVKVS